LVLDQRLDPVKPGLEKIGGQGIQASFPGSHFSWREGSTELVTKLFGQRGHKRPIVDLRPKMRDRSTVKRHDETSGSMSDFPQSGGGLSQTRLSGRSGFPTRTLSVSQALTKLTRAGAMELTA